MVKYDTKEIVTLFINARNSYNEFNSFIERNGIENSTSDYLNLRYYYLGCMDAYKRIILSFFGVSITNFDNFINAVVYGG